MKMIEEMIGAGTGLYTLGEAAKYARIHPVTVSRWFKGDGYCKRVFPAEEARVITFLDFVQVLAVRNLRVHYNLKLQKIRDAIEHASKEFGIDHPFARKHTTFLFDNNIWIKLEGQAVVQISGKEHGQKGLPVIEKFYEDISFDPEKGGIAVKYKAFEGRGHKIIMNPNIRFGEPILEGSGYTPQALFEAAKTEGSISAAAEMYGVSFEEVAVCIDYLDHLEAA